MTPEISSIPPPSFDQGKPSQTLDNWIRHHMEGLKKVGLYRAEQSAWYSERLWRDTEHGVFLNFASNDYLGLSHRSDLCEAAIQAIREWGAGSGASRLVTGTRPIHLQLESEIASFKGYAAARVFGTGMMAAMGIIPALFGGDCEIFADRLSHACLLDGSLLAGSRLRRFHHNDPDHLKKLLETSRTDRRKLIITESIFSMDGDIAPLAELAEIAETSGALLLVDEAHATGVWGEDGGGLVSALGLQGKVPISMGTFSKALGSQGGFICGSELLADWIVNTARTYIYTTAPAPATVGAALAAIHLLRTQPGLGNQLLSKATALRATLQGRGFNTGASVTQILPIMIGKNQDAAAIATALQSRGLRVPAIRPPTVPEGLARLRISLCLNHRDEDIAHLVESLEWAFDTCGVKRCPRSF